MTYTCSSLRPQCRDAYKTHTTHYNHNLTSCSRQLESGSPAGSLLESTVSFTDMLWLWNWLLHISTSFLKVNKCLSNHNRLWTGTYQWDVVWNVQLIDIGIAALFAAQLKENLLQRLAAIHREQNMGRFFGQQLATPHQTNLEKSQNIYIYIYIYKGKAIPLQAWTGPEGSRSLRLPDFKTIGTWRW